MARLTHNQLTYKLMQRGLSPQAAYGLAANSEVESGHDTAAVGDDGTSFGLFQWHGPRGEALKQYAAQRHTHWTDPDTQIDFLFQELPQFGDLEERLRNETSPAKAAKAFAAEFEQPANLPAQAQKRVAVADRLWQGFLKQLNPIGTAEAAEPTPDLSEFDDGLDLSEFEPKPKRERGFIEDAVRNSPVGLVAENAADVRGAAEITGLGASATLGAMKGARIGSKLPLPRPLRLVAGAAGGLGGAAVGAVAGALGYAGYSAGIKAGAKAIRGPEEPEAQELDLSEFEGAQELDLSEFETVPQQNSIPIDPSIAPRPPAQAGLSIPINPNAHATPESPPQGDTRLMRDLYGMADVAAFMVPGVPPGIPGQIMGAIKGGLK